MCRIQIRFVCVYWIPEEHHSWWFCRLLSHVSGVKRLLVVHPWEESLLTSPLSLSTHLIILPPWHVQTSRDSVMMRAWAHTHFRAVHSLVWLIFSHGQLSYQRPYSPDLCERKAHQRRQSRLCHESRSSQQRWKMRYMLGKVIAYYSPVVKRQLRVWKPVCKGLSS